MPDMFDLYTAIAEARASEFVKAHPEYLRRDVADAARKDFARAFDQDKFQLAYVTALAAAGIYNSIGDRAKSLRTNLDAEQAKFMFVEEMAGYDEVRRECRRLHELALAQADDQVCFRILVLAADSSWFAAQSAPGGFDGLEPRLVATLRDVLEALRAAGPAVADPQQANWIERLASLLAAAVVPAMSRHWPRAQHEVEQLLRQLAVAADVLPVDLPFERRGPRRLADVVAVLAELDARYR